MRWWFTCLNVYGCSSGILKVVNLYIYIFIFIYIFLNHEPCKLSGRNLSDDMLTANQLYL